MRERLKKTMPSKAHHEILTAVGSICTQNLLLPIALVITVVGAVVTALVPPLILENIVDGLTAGNSMPIVQAFSYFGVVALAGLLESTRESLFRYHQHVCRRLHDDRYLRSALAEKPRTRDYSAGSSAADRTVYKTCSEKNAGCADGQQKGCCADVGSCAGDDSLHSDDPCFWKRRLYAQTL